MKTLPRRRSSFQPKQVQTWTVQRSNKKILNPNIQPKANKTKQNHAYQRAPKSYSYGKVFYTLTGVICFSLFAWQFVVCVNRYLSYPITTVSTRTEPKETYLPSITICNNHLRFPLAIQENENKSEQKKSISVEDMKNVWIKYGIFPDNLTILRPTNNYTIEKIDSDVKILSINTLLGRCSDVTVVYPVYQRFYGAEIYIDPHEEIQNYQDVPDGYNIYIHVPELINTFEIFENTRLPWASLQMKLYFDKKEYFYLNSPKKPCTSVELNLKCKKNCVLRLLEKYAKCKVLTMDEANLPFCTSWANIIDILELYNMLQVNGVGSSCSCIRPCKVIEYKVNHVESGFNARNDQAVVFLNVLNSFDESLTEYYAYPFTSLINDFAAIIGFFLGLSLYGIFVICKRPWDQAMLYLGNISVLNKH